MRFSADRREGEWIVLVAEDNTAYDVPAKDLQGVSEGDLIEAELQDGRVISYKILKEETERERAELQGRLSALFKRSEKK